MDVIEVDCHVGTEVEEMDEAEGVLRTTSDIEARGQEAAGVAALDLNDATEQGETTEGHKGASML
jgi:hypothetical protein